jgi:uncharacterized protein involved in exopolysaccharide biosynthesis
VRLWLSVPTHKNISENSEHVSRRPRSHVHRQIQMEYFLAVLSRNRFLIVGTFISALLVAGIIAVAVPRRYASHMKILVKHRRADPDPRNETLAQDDISESQINTELELLSSTDLLSRVVSECRLEEHEGGRSYGADPPNGERVERAVRILGRQLKINPVRKANIISISYEAASPTAAVVVLRTLATAYLDYHLAVHRTPGAQEFFRNQASHYQSALAEAESMLYDLRRRAGLTSIAQEKELIRRKALDAESEVHQTESALAEASASMQQLRSELAGQLPRVTTQSRVVPNQFSVERLNTMLAELENRRISALARFLPGDSIVVEIEKEIASTTDALRHASTLNSVEQSTDINAIRQTLESDLSRARFQEKGLSARREALLTIVTGYKTRLRALEAAAIEHENLERSVKVSEEHYLLYSRKEEDARIADSLDQQKISNVAIAEAPREQYLPSTPSIKNTLALGALVGAFLSVILSMVSEQRRHTFATPTELEKSTGEIVLATVPFYLPLVKKDNAHYSKVFW